jgi:hypothetical protein
MMRRALIGLLALGLWAPVCHAETMGAQALADALAGSHGGSPGISFPVISGWVMWRVRVAGGDVTVHLHDKARVNQTMAEAAGRQACHLLGRSFAGAVPEVGAEVWTWRGACL